MAIEHVKLSHQAREQLIRLKRHTGIEHWNVLCRWALCVSLAESTIPPMVKIAADSNVEMSWRVFGGRYADIFTGLVRQRCIRDGLEANDETVATQFRLHLHRGIGYLATDRTIRSIASFAAVAVPTSGNQSNAG